METPWNRSRKTPDRKQEEKLARLPEGQKQLNSGRTSWRSKRDNILGDYLIEARTTEAESYRIDRHEFLAIQKHAFQTPPGKLPAMQPTIRGLELWVMRLIDFEAMRGRITELEAELAAYRNDAGE